MNRQPVPIRESHRDSRSAKVRRNPATSKPEAKKFSTTFSTISPLPLARI